MELKKINGIDKKRIDKKDRPVIQADTVNGDLSMGTKTSNRLSVHVSLSCLYAQGKSLFPYIFFN